MEFISSCPLCKNNSFKIFLTGSDYFLTGETFQICECNVCGFLFTNPRPDKTEILKYYESPEYLSHDTSQNEIFSWFYRRVRKKNIRKKYRLVKKFSIGKKILDLGCGTGEFIHYCSGKGFQSIGIEPNEKARSFGIRSLKQDIRPESALEDIPAGSLDVITLWHVLEHIHGLDERMARLKKILKPGGILVIAVPNSNSWDAMKYEEYWAGYDLPRHLYHFNMKTLADLIEKNNFKLLETDPMKYDAFYISLLSEKYKSGKRNILSAIFNGIRSNIFAKKNNNNYSSIIFIAENLKSLK
jgi:2-polyprenyl-3-methyl-5-hydroxy-6-metoxy-1,4-benzoquinol methylase